MENVMPDEGFVRVAGTTEKIEPMSLPIEGKMRKGIFYVTAEVTVFLSVHEGALYCHRLKVGNNGIRATATEFVVPGRVMNSLFPPPPVFVGTDTLKPYPNPPGILESRPPHLAGVERKP